MTDLLALGIEQEGAHRWRGHVRPGHRPDGGRSNRGDTCHGKEQEGIKTGWETRIGGEGEEVTFHIAESPKTSKGFYPRQMCSRCSLKEILISRLSTPPKIM